MTADDDVSTPTSGGYQNIVPVDRSQLKNLGVNEESCKLFAATKNTAHLNIVEFFHALPYYPIAFVKQNNNDFTPCAILGLGMSENLFTDKDGTWLDGIYCPAYIRRYPFITEGVSIAELDDSADDLRKPIYVDKNGLIEEAASLFVANGVATAEWDVIESFISDYISAEKLTLSFTQKLDSLELLEPFDAQIHPDAGDMTRLKGLYRVNEDRLNQLPAKIIKDLMSTGQLSRIYAHLISLENFAKLLDRKATKNNKS